MRRKYYLPLICALFFTLLAGCWNRRELNELAVSVAIGVDKKGDDILISDQVLNTQAISGKAGGASLAPVTLFQETGKGLQEAARRMTERATRKIYVGQLQMLILGEAFAREGVGKVMDHISRDHEYRNDFYVVVARGAKAKDILRIYTPLEKTPATKIRASIEVSEKAWGATSAVRIDDFRSAIISKGREAVLTGINVEGNYEIGNSGSNVEKIQTPASLKYSGLAIFKKDKLIGWLNENEALGFNYTQGKIKSTAVALQCPEEKENITVELLRTKNKINVVIKDGKPAFTLQIKAEGNITDTQCGMDFTNQTSILAVERLTEKRILASIQSAVNITQKKFKSDIFGLGEELERKHPKFWEQNKRNWDTVFSTLPIDIRVDVKIKKMYRTSKSFLERMKE